MATSGATESESKEESELEREGRGIAAVTLLRSLQLAAVRQKLTFCGNNILSILSLGLY